MLYSWLLLLLPTYVKAIGQATCVSFTSSPSSFSVVNNGQAAPVLISADDWPGVQRAASDFVSDIQKVTGHQPSLTNVTAANSTRVNLKSSRPIIIGTLGKSSLIDQIINSTKLDVSSIEGQWEAFLTKEVSNPLPGVASAYVIIGSNKRGTIFALYDHSEQFGVSPWYWWADVPVTKHSNLFVSPSGCSHGPPTVQYRGIFLNDEQPALQNWAMEKFTNGTGAALTGSPFNQLFYTKLFELILRLKGNYLWPAQWSSAFYVDDAENAPMADYYGIAMGTSHEEPMARSIPVEWTLFGQGPWDYSSNSEFIYQFWVNSTIRAKPYETVFTIGMRGDGDTALPAGEGIPLLQKVIADQRTIMTDVFNGTDVTTIPQMWCLYKEVEGYYDEGLAPPDDVTLLWTDDNWGNIRRYPVESERSRPGGAGVYYHVDYVGDPRDYKWITSSQIPKIHEQLSIAVERNATRIWILNVGDLKPYERETEFFLTYGWNSSVWNPDNLNTYVNSWAQREFDLSSENSAIVTEIVANLTRWNARRKPELVNSTTFSLVNYREAETILDGWQTLLQASTKLYNSLSTDIQPAFFELIHHPVSASANLNNLSITAGKNNLRGSQAFLSTNDLADQVEELFEKDFDFETEYHTLLDGKWDHMMDQTHLGYYYWQQPMTNTMPNITRVQKNKQALAGIMRIAPELSLAAWPGDNMFQCPAEYSCPPPTITIDSFDTFGSRYIDVGAAGPQAFDYDITSNVSWIQISTTHGSISPSNTEERVFLSISDWSKLEAGPNYGGLNFTATATGTGAAKQLVKVLTVPVYMVANNTKATLPSGFKGFVETGGVTSIDAVHPTRNNSVDGIAWTELPGLGRTLSSITPLPRTGNDGNNFTAGAGPSLEYDFYSFVGGNITITILVSPSMNANGDDRPLGFAIQLDSLQTQSSYFMPPAPPGDLPDAWDSNTGFAADSIVPVTMQFTGISPGSHTLKLFEIEPAVVVQKFLIDTGSLLQSYLGPPESIVV